jgi:hypothetical protein
VRAVAVLAILAAAACSRDGDDDDDATPIPTSFDLDVVIGDSGVELWLRNFAEFPCSPAEQFPRPGECAEYTDAFGCTGNRAACFTRIALERDGVELDTVSFDLWVNAFWLSHADLFAGGDVDVVLEGCGAEHRIPINRVAAQAPTLIDLTTDGTLLHGTTNPTGTTGTVAELSGSFDGRACHQASDDAWQFTPGEYIAHRADLWLASIVEAPTLATPWGEARVWNRTWRTASTPILVPSISSGAWELDDRQEITTRTTVDGGTPAASGLLATWGFRQIANGARIYVLGGNFEYVAGETTDTLTIDLIDGRFTGTFPHVAPTNDLDMALAGDNHVAITIGPITVTHESMPALTHQITLDLAWDHPLVPRPVVMP